MELVTRAMKSNLPPEKVKRQEREEGLDFRAITREKVNQCDGEEADYVGDSRGLQLLDRKG